jgi:selenocysteine lyase/cysteine desulfurase
VALSRNTTDGINWVANGLPWEKGDRIVTINNEYPANMYPWMRLEQKGVELHLIEPVDHRVTLEQVEAALTSNTRLLTISFVAFSTGFRANLPALGALCKEKNVLLFVDLIQGMGVFPLDLKNWGVTFASGGAQKWLLGPPGAGFFYCAQENLDLLEVTMTGADCVQTILPYTDYDLTLRDDAVRFEYGTHAMLPQVGMQASLSLLLDAGMENTEACVKTSSDILVDGAKRKGYTCLSPRNDDEWSGIVILSHPTQSPETIVNQLKSKNIWAMEREGHIRLAPHFYHTEEEMKQVVDNL